VPQDKLPTVTMTFAFDFGSVSDPKKQVGLTSICMDLLDEGTKKYETAAFEEKQADHAVNVSSFGGQESAGINVNALTLAARAGARPDGRDAAGAGDASEPTSTAQGPAQGVAAAGQGEPGPHRRAAVLDAGVGRGSPVWPHRDRGEHRRGDA
jgi:hypothetical protein